MNTVPTPLLETLQLELRAGTRALLSALDWRVCAGEFWCVLGLNGAGKSSLLHVVAGLSQPAQGDIFLGGAPLESLTPSALALQRGLLQQQQHDAFSMPVLDAVKAGGFARSGSWGEDALDSRRALMALEQVGLAALARSDLLTLSGGERQRVGLATLLVQDPSIFLLDEPTSHQDIAAQLAVMALLRDLAAQGKAVIASCHDLNLARRFATHALLLGAGRHLLGHVSDVMHADGLEEVFGCRFRTIAGEGMPLFVPVANG